MKPLGENCILKVEKVISEKTSGGIVIELEKTSDRVEEVTEGVIIAVGSDTIDDLVEGSSVYFETHGGHTVTIDGEEFVIVTQKNILAVK